MGICLLPFRAFKKGQRLPVVHETALYKSGSTTGVLEDVEAGLLVWITIGVVRPQLMTGQVLLSSAIQRSSQMIAGSQPRRSVTAPARGVVPLAIGTCGIDMDRNEHNVVSPKLVAPAIHSFDSLLQGNVLEFGDKDLRIIAPVLQVCYDGVGDFTIVLIFAEMAVGRAFARTDIITSIFDKSSPSPTSPPLHPDAPHHSSTAHP